LPLRFGVAHHLKKFIWLVEAFLFAIRLLLWKTKIPPSFSLEMGVDRPGDIKYLTNIARPSIAILTAIATSHRVFAALKIAEKKKYFYFLIIIGQC
jgi:hypothetical protein